MKIGEIKNIFREKFFSKYQKTEVTLNFIEGLLISALGNDLQNGNEYDLTYTAQVIGAFQKGLSELTPTINIAGSDCTALLRDDINKIFRASLSQDLTKGTLSKSAVGISNGLSYGPNNEWHLSLPPPVAIPFSYGAYYGADLLEEKGKASTAELVVIEDCDSQNAAFRHVQKGWKTVVLNVANRFDIGGSWREDKGTMEESLFFTTNIHLSLNPMGYESNGRYCYHKPLGHEKEAKSGGKSGVFNSLYSSNVNCFKRALTVEDALAHRYQECEPFTFNVHTLAGFDLNSGQHSDQFRFLKNNGADFDWSVFMEKTQKKFEHFFEVARMNGNDSVIATSLSCGISQHPHFLAQVTYEAKAYIAAAIKYQNHFESIAIVALNPELAKALKEQIKEAKEREATIGELGAYIERINKNKDSTGEIDFAKGFWFFAETRALNRRANYLLAQKLAQELDENKNDSLVNAFSNILEKRNQVIQQNAAFFPPAKFINRGINSATLNDIIKRHGPKKR